MTIDRETLTGGCRCGKIRFSVEGTPLRTGLCHCADCRKESGGAFLYYADWPRNRFSVTGTFATYEGRSFCTNCGSRLFHLSEDEAEICIGALDTVPSRMVPAQEGWTIRREPWLGPVAGAGQFERDVD